VKHLFDRPLATEMDERSCGRPRGARLPYAARLHGIGAVLVVDATAAAVRRMQQRVGPRGLATRESPAVGIAVARRLFDESRESRLVTRSAPPDWRRAAGRLTVSPRAPSPAGPVRQNRGVRVERNRENVFTVTATGQELSALIAGARLALDAMRASADAPATAIELLGRVLDDFDRSRERLAGPPPDGDRR
jgi:hypothetical protein